MKMKFEVHTEDHTIVVPYARSAIDAERIAAYILGGHVASEMRHVDCDCCLEVVRGIRDQAGKFGAFLGVFPLPDDAPSILPDADFTVAGALMGVLL